MGMPTEVDQELMEALYEVNDPEFPVSVVDMGLIYDARREGAAAIVTMTFTSTGCGCMHWIEEDVRERLLQVRGIEEVRIDVVWEPAWTRDRLSPKALETFRRLGMGV